MNPRILNRESIAPRASTWQQIEVAGEHPAMLGDRRLTQVIDAEAMEAIAADFRAEAADPYFDGLLVDADHLSHDGEQRTEAYAWLMNVEVREGQLWGRLEWTDLGSAAVAGRRYKYFSTEYDAGDLEDLGGGRVRPRRLAGLALTNRPNNKGGRPITNRRAEAGQSNTNPTQEDKPTMKNIATKLGLPEDAGEEDILAAIGELQTDIENVRQKEAEIEADEILNRHAKRIPEGQREAWRDALLANREGAEKLILTLPEAKEAGPPAKSITNRATAKTPEGGVGGTARIGDDAARAAKIRNRAAEIQKVEGLPFAAAFVRAEAETAN
ncbi:MAG TPA: phage protease [Bacteroidia bacterium]|nr:phage protease [Bacteroidia bacterium]